tara:strand:- start:242 stop:871 length:630 start_codon:yes stop_codon:yes gene_type:complete
MPLPDFLINRYKDWKSNIFNQKKNIYKKAAEENQKPLAMFISCCDSRVLENSIFKGEVGEYFIHKNIANLVPPFDDDSHSIGAAIEYAVKSLNIKHIVVLGHQNCGGINYGYHLHSSKAKKNKMEFIDKWLYNLKIPLKKIPNNISINDQIKMLEKESIKTSLENLLTYPFLKESIENHRLKIHGLWYEISTGKIMNLNSNTNKFEYID